MINFDSVWVRIKSHEGEIFRLKRGATFRFAITNSAIVPDRTNRNIPRAQIEEATKFLPFVDTRPLQHFQGPSYIYAFLMDRRIRLEDW